MSSRIDYRLLERVASYIEPPFAPGIAELIEALDEIVPDDEREPDADFEPDSDFEPWLSTGTHFWCHIGPGLDHEHEDRDDCGSAPFELDQTERLVK